MITMCNKLNVIFLGTFLYPNGYAATKRKQQFLDYIYAQGDNARVLITLKWTKGHEMNKNKGSFKDIRYEVIGTYVKPNIFFPITFFVFTIETFFKLNALKSKTSKNILVAFEIFYDNLFPIIFGYLIGYKVIFDIVEDFSSLESSKTIKEKIKHFLLLDIQKIIKSKIAAGISVVTKYLLNKHKEQVNKNLPIVLIPVSAENINFKVLQENKQEKSNFTFLYSGTYGKKEGLKYLFEAFYKFTEIHKNVKLVLTGNCPEKIREQLDTLYGIYDHIIFTGRLDDVEYYSVLTEADVLLMTRRNSTFANAGFPYKMGEYLATGKPSICTNVSDISLYLKNMESAIIVEPENSVAILNAMLFLYNNPQRATEIGQKGREVCLKYFNPEINSKMFYELLQQC